MIRTATFSFLMATICLVSDSSRVAADYTQGGSLLSWEWLTDVSNTIVVGKVTEVDDTGAFKLRIEKVLLQQGSRLSIADTVSGPVLGHSIPYLEYLGDPSMAHELGWPVLADKSTYPARSRRNLPSLKPQLKRQEDWGVGDRCLAFYGADNVSPMQVINLDKPLTIEVPFLTVDVSGKAVNDPDKLIADIQQRLAQLESHRRFAGTFHYVAWKSDLDGADYYGVLVPASEPGVTKGFKEQLANTPDPVVSMQKMFWKTHTPSAMGAWKYWFGSDRQQLDFGRDAVLERRYAIEYLLANRPHFAKEYAVWVRYYHDPRVNLDQDRLYVRLHKHMISQRTYPRGWDILLSNDGHRFAYIDANSLWLYEVNQREQRCGLRLHQDRECDIVRSKMQFSNDNRLLAYNRSDGSVCVVDTLEGNLLWESSSPQMPQLKSYGTPEFFGASIHFSHDSRYLAQYLFVAHARPVLRRNGQFAYHQPSKIFIWDVKTGEQVFTPHSQYTIHQKFDSFDPENSDLFKISVEAKMQSWSISNAGIVDAGVDNR